MTFVSTYNDYVHSNSIWIYINIEKYQLRSYFNLAWKMIPVLFFGVYVITCNKCSLQLKKNEPNDISLKRKKKNELFLALIAD